MKKVFVVIALLLIAGQGLCVTWKVESFLLPGINQAMQGRWVEAGFFFGMDAIIIAVASNPIEKIYYLSHTPGDYIIIRDYTFLWAGIGMYAGMGIIANLELRQNSNIKLISCDFEF